MLILFTEQATAAQLRDHQLDEQFQLVGQHRRHDVEAVCALLFQPQLEVVGDLCGGAYHHAVATRTGRDGRQRRDFVHASDVAAANAGHTMSVLSNRGEVRFSA